MPNFQTYNIVPTLPAALEPLREVSFNVWWTWEPSARRLFRHLDPELWNRTNHNPIRMLQLSRQARLEELATDKTFLRELKQVYDAFVFFRRIRISRINPELFRRPRHSLRRPLQIRQRLGSKLRRHRVALSARIFPAGNR
jgi:DNA mismatch repair ATPase MutS